ncbi:MAG: phosphoglucosamine mutase [Pirellulaceae bacterium]
MKEPIISVSGLRGVIGESLSPELAMRFACAFAAGRPDGTIVVSRDGRASGPMLAEAVRAGLCGVGRSVLDADIAATPTTGVLIRHHAAVGGIQISASHNPPPYNGLKLFDAQGQVLSAESGERVVQQYRGGETNWVDHLRLGSSEMCTDTLARHAELVLATVDVQRIRQRQFRVLLDSNGGAGSLLGRRLLEDLGCQWTVLGAETIGQFEHPPEPTAENLAGVRQRVAEATAEIGFCQDPDADRLAVIDEKGRYLGEEFTLALCLDHVLRQQKGPVVTNCSTSRMAQDLAEKYGVPFHRSAVGEANVVALMRETSAVFGGEGNGGPIDPRVGYVRDSFVGMAQILDAMAARRCAVSQLADALPHYAICKTKVPLQKDRIAAALDSLEREFAEATPDRLDGLRLDWPDRWLLVRASNTEPIVRAVAEAPRQEAAQGLCDQATEIIKSV